MKTFQKITLAAAISAAPFMAQADLVPMEDALMGETTGQAGVTIDISIEGAGISVGEIVYTDTASTTGTPAVTVADVDTTGDGTADANSGGSVILQDLNISGISNLTQTIDVLEDGDLYMTTTGVDGVTITLGDDVSVATGLANNDRSAVQLSGTAGTAELVNDLSVTMNLGASTTRIINMANTDTLGTAASVTGSSANDWAALAIQANASFEITDMNAGIFGYTESDAARKTAGDIAAAVGGGAVWTDYADVTDGVVSLKTGAAGEDIAIPGQGTAAQVAASRANGSAVGIKGLKFYGETGVDTGEYAAGNAVTVEQTIWANSDGVSIQVGAIKGALEIGAIEIGGASIGSVMISDINLSGLTQTIRGH